MAPDKEKTRASILQQKLEEKKKNVLDPAEGFLYVAKWSHK